MDDNEIIALFFSRSEQAIDALSGKYGKLCQIIAGNILGNQLDAEECVNDTYLKAWKSIPPARPTVLSAFLTKITRNLALDRYRASKRQKRNGEFTVMLSELGDCIPAPEDGDGGELVELLNQFLELNFHNNFSFL